MKASAIVYASQTGFTGRYARMLGEASQLPVYPLEEAAGALPRRTPVVFLGWLCAGRLKGLEKAMGRWDVRAACAVGMSAEDQFRPDRLARQLGDAPLFYLRGGYDPKRLRGIYRLMMIPMTRAAARGGLPPEMGGALLRGGDWVDKAALGPVLAWLE